jgi:hypothetical protein
MAALVEIKQKSVNNGQDSDFQGWDETSATL